MAICRSRLGCQEALSTLGLLTPKLASGPPTCPSCPSPGRKVCAVSAEKNKRNSDSLFQDLSAALPPKHNVKGKIQAKLPDFLWLPPRPSLCPLSYSASQSWQLYPPNTCVFRCMCSRTWGQAAPISRCSSFQWGSLLVFDLSPLLRHQAERSYYTGAIDSPLSKRYSP